jgi:hypothetical protein
MKLNDKGQCPNCLMPLRYKRDGGDATTRAAT